MQRMPLKSRWGKIYILWHLNKKCKHRASATCLAGTDGDRLTFVTALRKVLGDICYRLLPCALDMDKKPCEDNRTNVPSVFDDLHKQQAFSLYSLSEYCGSSQLSKACHRESSYKIHCKTNSQKNSFIGRCLCPLLIRFVSFRFSNNSPYVNNQRCSWDMALTNVAIFNRS